MQIKTGPFTWQAKFLFWLMIKMVDYSQGYTGPAERLATLFYLFASIVAATGVPALQHYSMK
jgi:hypothetical protein